MHSLRAISGGNGKFTLSACSHYCLKNHEMNCQISGSELNRYRRAMRTAAECIHSMQLFAIADILNDSGNTIKTPKCVIAFLHQTLTHLPSRLSCSLLDLQMSRSLLFSLHLELSSFFRDSFFPSNHSLLCLTRLTSAS